MIPLNAFHRNVIGSFVLFIAPLTLLFAVTSHAQTQTYTYADLIKRLTDPELLAVLPPVGEKTALASSYDRASRYDAMNDKYIGWDANDDGRGIIREENGQEVLAEIQGPGCIWRTWSARPQEGHVKIYLDGATTPTIDLPFLSYFYQKGFRAEPFTRPNLVYQVAKGFDNFTPIPFAKSCRIVADKGWGLYYHFNYTQFPAGTVVPTFSMKMRKEDLAALDHANEILGHCGHDPAGPRGKIETLSVTIPNGESKPILESSGEGAVVSVELKIEDMPKDIEKQRRLLGLLSIKMTWDGAKEPAVWSLFGDFFGAAAGAAPFQTLLTGLRDDGTFYCYWYMPFASSARIEIGNDTGAPVSIQHRIWQVPLTRPISELARFHAKWHRDEFLPERKDRWPDWTLVTTKGRGRFVGTQLHIWSPLGGWWGEGDEKFYVDGEKFPSTFGTGSEDYFGYAWGSGETFAKPFHSQPFSEDAHGHMDLNRWHISDNVPFQTSFEGDIEKYFFNERPGLYAAVGYWYLSTDGTDPYTSIPPVKDRVGWWVRPPVFYVKDAIEAEKMKVLDSGGEQTDIGEMAGWKLNAWSNDHDLQWESERVGEKLKLQFTAPATGKFHLIAHFTHAPQYGIFQMSFDGTPMGAPIDLFDPAHDWGVLPERDLGTVEVKAGLHELGAEVTGKNPSSPKYHFGLDYIKLVPAK
jgi:hypothetical protein